MVTPLVDFLWSQLNAKYTPTSISIPDRGNKAWRPYLGGSSSWWTWERLGQVYKMMQRMDTMPSGERFLILPWSYTNWALCVPRLRLRECRRHYKHCRGWMVRWYIIWVGLPSKVWIAWTHIPLETGGRWFESGKTQLHFSRRWCAWMTKACLGNQRFWIPYGGYLRRRVDCLCK